MIIILRPVYNSNTVYLQQGQSCIQWLASKYKFMLAFEMDICQDFISFKLFSVLDQPTTIAVVMGGVDYAKILPPKSYIDVSDFKSAKDLSNYLLYLDAHNGKWNNVISNQ